MGVCGLAGAFFTRLLDMARPQKGFSKETLDKEIFNKEDFVEAKPVVEEKSVTEDFAHHSAVKTRFALSFVVWTALTVICGCLMWGTLADVPQWKNDGTLMQAEIRYDRNFLPAKTGEAYLYDREGKNEEAIASYDQAVHQLLPEARTVEDVIRAALAPDMPRRVASASSLRYNDVPYLATSIAARGGLKQRLERWDGAAEDYRAALALNPKDDTMGDWLAYAYDHAGNLAAEEAALKAQIARRADSYRLAQLGDVYFRQGRWALARDTLAQALRAPASDTGSIVRRCALPRLQPLPVPSWMDRTSRSSSTKRHSPRSSPHASQKQVKSKPGRVAAKKSASSMSVFNVQGRAAEVVFTTRFSQGEHQRTRTTARRCSGHHLQCFSADVP